MFLDARQHGRGEKRITQWGRAVNHLRCAVAGTVVPFCWFNPTQLRARNSEGAYLVAV